MSEETYKDLRSNLIGYKAEHGDAWFGTEEGNSWDGPVPMERVRELFGWEAIAAPLTATVSTLAVSEEGEPTMMEQAVPVDGRIAVVRSDTSEVLGIFRDGYQIHQYRDWLLDNVANVLDVSSGDMLVGSAGLLRKGGQAWVQIRPNDGIEIGGDTMIPWLLAATSHDGTIATQYRPAVTRVVCDNTLRMALGERTANVWKNKHTSRSLNRADEARAALDLIFTATDAFAADVEELMNTSVTDAQFRAIVERLDPTVADDASARAQTNQAERRGTILNLWANDRRIGEYGSLGGTQTGTAWGVLQSFNTQAHWLGTPATRTAERQMARTIGGDVDKDDATVLAAIRGVLADA